MPTVGTGEIDRFWLLHDAAEPDEVNDALSPARGIVTATALSMFFWGLVIACLLA